MLLELTIGDDISRLHFYRDQIEQAIAGSLVDFGERNELRDACEYALKSSGKRIRALQVLLIADALGNDLNAMEAALSVEFFHVASLIVDDLPCMDDGKKRHGRLPLHKVFGDAIALLASYSLISAAFGKIHQAVRRMEKHSSLFADQAASLGMVALGHAACCAGILGASGGQFCDLFVSPLNLESLKRTIYKKTITLFEVAFAFGWIFGGGSLVHFDKIKESAYHFGMAFQIADDINDMLEDSQNQLTNNIAIYMGKEKSYSLFKKELDSFRSSLLFLKIYTPSFEKMCTLLSQMVATNSS